METKEKPVDLLTMERLALIFERVEFPGYRWWMSPMLDRSYYLIYAEFKDVSGESHKTRKWYVNHRSTESEVVQTMLKCVLTSMEHEVREQFLYRGKPIFGPHYDIESLHAVCNDNGGRRDARKETTLDAEARE